MENMFSGAQNKKTPKSVKECLKPDPVSTNLWIWCQRLETLGKILFWIILIGGIILSIITALVKVEVGGTYYSRTETQFDVIIFFTSLVETGLYALIEYCVYHMIALLVGALGSIVQNTKLSADLALYRSSLGEDKLNLPDDIDEDDIDDSIDDDVEVFVGDCIIFGSYEQDNDIANGKEGIEWIVLKKMDGKKLLISKYGLDCQKYNTSKAKATWETCTLRKWLNEDFLNTAFTEEEKAIISTVTVPADKNPEYDTDSGNATQDKVFLLSIEEAEKYFDSDYERKCQPTAYAIANGAWENNASFCWWWLRSQGRDQVTAAYVNRDGGVSEFGNFVDDGRSAVRPAMWIEVDT